MSLSSFGVRRASRRFDIFWIAARPRAAFGMQQFIAVLNYATSRAAFGLRYVRTVLIWIAVCIAALELSNCAPRIAFFERLLLSLCLYV